MNQPSEKTIATLDKINIACLFVFTAFSMFSISITQIAGFLGGLAWIFRTHLTGNWQEQRWPLGIIFALFALASMIAVINAFDPSYSYKELRKLLEILIFFWVVNCVREERLRDSLSTILIIAATLACFYSFYQGWKEGFRIMHRAEGTMSVYMTFAGIIMLVGMHASGKLLFRRPVDPLILTALVIICISLVFTFTRQAWFGFLVGLFFLIFIWKKRLTFIISGVIIILILVYGSQARTELDNLTAYGNTIDYWWGGGGFTGDMKYRINRMLNPGQDETFQMRVALWKGGWEIFKDNTWLGCGFKCVDLIHTKYPDPTGHISGLRGMHNNFVQLAVDTGIFGLSAWLGIWVCFFREMYKRAKNLESDQSSKWVIAGSSAAVIAFLAGGCFESNLYDSEVVSLLYFIMALPFTGSKINKIAEGNTVIKKIN